MVLLKRRKLYVPFNLKYLLDQLRGYKRCIPVLMSLLVGSAGNFIICLLFILLTVDHVYHNEGLFGLLRYSSFEDSLFILLDKCISSSNNSWALNDMLIASIDMVYTVSL
ncbi:hypothetical protein BD408DRAFT_232323 [Parasitella parasitica]|nr:hypothetical protein BD408DRAFT_232323 [Parasitella parasitica]